MNIKPNTPRQDEILRFVDEANVVEQLTMILRVACNWGLLTAEDLEIGLMKLADNPGPADELRMNMATMHRIATRAAEYCQRRLDEQG